MAVKPPVAGVNQSSARIDRRLPTGGSLPALLSENDTIQNATSCSLRQSPKIWLTKFGELAHAWR
jgi:hypothetical protein